MAVTPYLMFEGRAEEAAAFYGKAIGAKVEMMLRFSECPDPMPEGAIAPGSEDKVMHMALRIGGSQVFASDGGCSGKGAFQGVSLALEAGDADEAGRLFEALADGGTVQMPMGKTFFSEAFGVLTDRFGLTWMVLVSEQT